MLNKDQKRRIKLYCPQERSRLKAAQRRVDAADSARGMAEEVQERNRALPPASQFTFPDEEKALPLE